MDRVLDSARPALEWRSLVKGVAVAAAVAAIGLVGPRALAMTRGLDVLTALLMGVLVVNVGVGLGLMGWALASWIHDLYHTHDAPPPLARRPLLVQAHHPRARS